MELFNRIRKDHEELIKTAEGKNLLKEALEALVLLLSPFSPHVCEELWEKMGHKTKCALHPWPVFDPDLAMEDMVTIIIQINGKIRDKFETERDTPEDKVKQRALDSNRIQNFLDGKEPKRIISIKNKLVNIVK